MGHSHGIICVLISGEEALSRRCGITSSTWTYLADLQIVPERPVGPLTSGSNYVGPWEGSMGECSCVYFKLKWPCAYVRVADVENN